MIRKALARRHIDRIVRRLEASILYDPKRGEFRSSAVANAVIDAGRAFGLGDYERAEQLVQVIEFMLHREVARHKADPEKWMARRTAELSA